MFVCAVCLIILLDSISRSPVNGYKNYSALNAIVFTNIDPPEDDAHSEYYFGKCSTYHKSLMQHDRWTFEKLKNRMIVRGWLDVDLPPTCVYIRSKSSYGDAYKYHAFKFGCCICALVYNYAGKKFVYYYYEWYIPVEIMAELTWDLYFYLS